MDLKPQFHDTLKRVGLEIHPDRGAISYYWWYADGVLKSYGPNETTFTYTFSLKEGRFLER